MHCLLYTSVIGFGILLYGAATTAAGFAPTMEFHVVMRGLQGLGQGFLLANILAFFGEFCDAEGRAKAMGLYGTLTGVVWVVAPMIGGVAGDMLGWRPVFYIAFPLAALIFILLLVFMPNLRTSQGKSMNMDWIGTISLVVGVCCLVLTFSWGGQKYAWNSPPIIGMIAGFFAALIVFLVNTRRCENAIISPKLFKNREYSLAALCVILIGPSMFAVGSYLSVFVIGIADGTATLAGTAAAVKSAVQLVLGYTLGVYVGKRGRLKLVMLTTAAVYVVSNLMLGWSGTDVSMIYIYAAALLSGYCTTGYSMCFTLHAQNNTEQDLVGEATSTIQFIQSLGGTIGLSIMGMVLNNAFTARLGNVVPEGLTRYASSEELSGYMSANILTNKSLADDFIAQLPEEGKALFAQMIENIRDAYSSAFGTMFLVLSLMCIVALVIICLMKTGSKAVK